MTRPNRRPLVIPALLAVLALPMFLIAQDAPRPPTTFLGLSLSSYLVSDKVFEEVYGGAGAMRGLVFTQRLVGAANFALDAALDFRSYAKTGASTLSQVEARLRIKPISLGLEGSLTRGIAILWMGLGLDLTSYAEESELQNTTGSTFGFHVAGGLALQPVRSFPLRIKLHLRWTKAGAMVNEMPVELGGPEYGLALLYGFRLF